MLHRRSLLAGAFVLLALSGCSDEPAGPTDTVTVQLVLISGDGQSAPAGEELPLPLVAEVQNGAGVPVKGVLVNFRVVSGGGQAFAGSVRTNAQGRVQDYWTLGPVAGTPQVMQVRAVRQGAKRIYATFNATALPPSSPPQLAEP
jgi:hypothetical protein